MYSGQDSQKKARDMPCPFCGRAVKSIFFHGQIKPPENGGPKPKQW